MTRAELMRTARNQNGLVHEVKTQWNHPQYLTFFYWGQWAVSEDSSHLHAFILMMFLEQAKLLAGDQYTDLVEALSLCASTASWLQSRISSGATSTARIEQSTSNNSSESATSNSEKPTEQTTVTSASEQPHSENSSPRKIYRSQKRPLLLVMNTIALLLIASPI
jgi:hypothetical protein